MQCSPDKKREGSTIQTATEKGLEYARYIAQIVADDPLAIRNLFTRLYPRAAAHFGTTPSNVEKAIRRYISERWRRRATRPSNGEFIMMLANSMV